MSGADDGPPTEADVGDDELTMALLLHAAQRYGMKTGATDWDAVAKAATGARRATTKLGLAAVDRPLRVVPPHWP